jgi:hypothetical protein
MEAQRQRRNLRPNRGEDTEEKEANPQVEQGGEKE